MEAKELRIGNWVNWTKPENKPTFERVYILSMDDINEDLPEFYDPIHLTPEILEKAGFQTYDDIKKLDVESDFGCELTYEKGHLFFYDCDGGKIGKEIKHIHQLQNLYFALTGEELPIDLK